MLCGRDAIEDWCRSSVHVIGQGLRCVVSGECAVVGDHWTSRYARLRRPIRLPAILAEHEERKVTRRLKSESAYRPGQILPAIRHLLGPLGERPCPQRPVA